MRKVLQSPWFWPVVGVLLLIILTRGQVLMALGPLSKYLIPLAGGYALYRIVKHKIKKTITANLHKTMADIAQAHRQAQDQMRRQRGGARNGFDPAGYQEQPVIEICPKCGEQKTAQCPDRCK